MGLPAFLKGRRNVKLVYEGTDITGYVDILKCVHKDVSGGRSDLMELELDHAGTWYAWSPRQNDTIRVSLDDYDTGTLYLNTILPEEGRYRILATSVPATANRKTWAAFENKTLAQIMEACSAECAMDYALYGINGEILYPFLLRANEGYAAFLSRLMEREGAVLKAVNGRLTGIGIPYAQNLTARQTIKITPEQQGVTHIKRAGTKYAGLVVRTPYAEASAIDTQETTGDTPVYTDLYASNDIIAGRWARGLLLQHNRRAELLRLEQMKFNAGMTALARVNVQSQTDIQGEWIVDEAEHDLLNKTTSVKLLRCISMVI